MYEPPTILPPQLGKWLASCDPALIAKAEAALRNVEPAANDLLTERIQAEHKRILYTYLGSFALAHTFCQHITRGNINTISAFCMALLIELPTIFLLCYFFMRPIVNRREALILSLAHRGDYRAVPLLLQIIQTEKTRSALLALLQNAVPDALSFSDDPKSKDRAALLRTKCCAIMRKRDGAISFSSTATATPDHVALWLALLPHLAADPHRKSRDVLRRIAEAHAQTLDEELIKNTAQTLFNGNTPPTATDTSQAKRWNTTAGNESPTLLQRLRRP